MFTGAVTTGLNCGDHSEHHFLSTSAGNILRSFVNLKAEAHTVAGAVFKMTSVSPQYLAADTVELRPVGAFGKLKHE